MNMLRLVTVGKGIGNCFTARFMNTLRLVTFGKGIGTYFSSWVVQRTREGL